MASTPAPRSPLALAALALCAAALGACHRDRVATTGSTYPYDVRTRHPYVLAEGARSLDVIPTGTGHIDPRQGADVEAFVVEYRRYGRGALVMDLPAGAAPAAVAAAERTAAVIRQIAAQGGVPASALVGARYAVADPGLAAPVRLRFERVQARVASQCGLFPQDLGVSDVAFDLRNEPSWNLGCANRANLAAQVADPVDLVRGRGEGRIDTVRRTQVIDRLRTGNDPSTAWRQDGESRVKQQVGQ